ncbi:MOFRL family protein [Paralcaligenes sp. KSB-10]|uniref:MOFRL family protein n=1 Tax=Paralcaligenes sp. KSB-10 TaxID=2901142 RepID=UPI00351D26C8
MARMFAAAVEAAQPGHCMAGMLPPPAAGRTLVIGAGKASAAMARAIAQGMRPRDHLDDNNGHGFFEALGDSLITGPTLTNVNDFRAILIAGPDPHTLKRDPP